MLYFLHAHPDIPVDPDHPELSLGSPVPHDYYQRAQQDGIRRTYGKEHWRRMAQDSLKESLAREQLNQNVAKNVIIFVGDGFGLGTSTLARIWEGNQMGMDGEEHYLSFEKFPYLALSKVGYCHMRWILLQLIINIYINICLCTTCYAHSIIITLHVHVFITFFSPSILCRCTTPTGRYQTRVVQPQPCSVV